MIRRFLVLFVALGAIFVALLPGGAFASGQGGPGTNGSPCTPTPNGGSGGAGCTITAKGLAFDLGPSDQFGCPNVPSGETLATVNAIFHVNINRAGDNWTTSTLSRSFTTRAGASVVAT